MIFSPSSRVPDRTVDDLPPQLRRHWHGRLVPAAEDHPAWQIRGVSELAAGNVNWRKRHNAIGMLSGMFR
jgi:hypothetical protein